MLLDMLSYSVSLQNLIFNYYELINGQCIIIITKHFVHFLISQRSIKAILFIVKLLVNYKYLAKFVILF